MHESRSQYYYPVYIGTGLLTKFAPSIFPVRVNLVITWVHYKTWMSETSP